MGVPVSCQLSVIHLGRNRQAICKKQFSHQLRLRSGHQGDTKAFSFLVLAPEMGRIPGSCSD